MTTLDRELVASIAPTIKQRNAFFDALFYDVGALSDAEKEELSPLVDQEGAIIVVPPASSHRRIAHFATVPEFLEEKGGSLRALAIAGVGSSVLGTAALARNVADAYGIEVAGIVSGYGVSDMVAEAIGGWFFYGALDAIRHEVRESVNRWKQFSEMTGAGARKAGARVSTPVSDINALDDILRASPPNLSLLIGHSKGDLMLDFALERFAQGMGKAGHPYFEQLRVVTLGAVTDLPPRFRHVHQFIGEIDWFGGMNSRLQVPHTRIPNAWHHLNTALPFHLPVAQVLKQKVRIG
jgi:hypothetical protein